MVWWFFDTDEEGGGVSTSLATLRRRILQELDLGFFLPTGATGFSAVAAGSVTAAYFLANSNWGGNQFNNWIIHRPDTATAADVIRYGNLLTNTTGLLTHSGVAYTDTTIGTETLELWKPVGIRPDTDFFNAANRALEWIYFPTSEPLSLAPDAACREADMASWGTAVNATAAKQTTASRIFSGIRSFAVTNSAANGYQPTTDIAVTPGETITIAAISRIQSGTSCRMIAYDVSNSVTFGSAVTHANTTFQFMWMSVVVPTGCHYINVRVGGTGTIDVTDWDSLWVYRPNARERVFLPAAYLDERYKLDALAYSPFHISAVAATGVLEATSIDPIEIPAEEYGTAFAAPEAHPAYVQFHGMAARNYPTWPMWVQMRLPYSERGLFVTDASTTTAPLHLLIAATKIELLRPQPIRDRITNGEKIYQDCLALFKDAVKPRTVEGPAARTAPYRMARA